MRIFNNKVIGVINEYLNKNKNENNYNNIVISNDNDEKNDEDINWAQKQNWKKLKIII